MKSLLHLSLSLFMIVCMLSCNAQPASRLTADAFEKGLTDNKDSIQLLDVRTPEEYQTGHLKNALLADWLDETEFKRRISFIDKNKPVYVYCLSGKRSAAAAEKMRSDGWKVYELTGGINAWKSANKPVEGKSTEKQMTLAELNTAITGSKTVLVDFGAEWCPPCKKMEPVLNSLKEKHTGKFSLVKVDGSRDQDLLKKYNVTALPVFIVFINGKQVWRKDGITSLKELEDQLIK